MNSIQAAAFHTEVIIKAGGPGSGRHSEGGNEKTNFGHERLLSKYGWNPSNSGNYSTDYRHKEFPNHRITVTESGSKANSWTHVDQRTDSLVNKGKGELDLRQHLHKFDKEN